MCNFKQNCCMINTYSVMSFINQTYEYGNINILMGHFKLILIVDVVINIVIHTSFSPNMTLLKYW